MPKFAAAVNCIDGRVQGPTAEHICGCFGVHYVDMITEPGPDRILAEQKDEVALRSIRARLDRSAQAHGSRLFFIVGHHDCASNPVSAAEHMAHLEIASRTLWSWMPEGQVFALWLDENWKVSQVRNGMPE